MQKTEIPLLPVIKDIPTAEVVIQKDGVCLIEDNLKSLMEAGVLSGYEISQYEDLYNLTLNFPLEIVRSFRRD